MKKLCAVLLAVFIFLISCCSAFAAGINAAEQSVLSNMRSPANMNGHKIFVPTAYINQAEAHFNTIDMTQQQADIKELSPSERRTLLSYASQAAAVLKLTAVAGSDETRIKITTKDGTIIVDESNNIIKTTGFSSLAVPIAAASFIFVVLILAAAGLISLKKRELENEEI